MPGSKHFSHFYKDLRLYEIIRKRREPTRNAGILRHLGDIAHRSGAAAMLNVIVIAAAVGVTANAITCGMLLKAGQYGGAIAAFSGAAFAFALLSIAVH